MFLHFSSPLKRFGDDLFFVDSCGWKNVLCSRNTVKHSITDRWYADCDSDLVRESVRIVEAAAKLIKDGIREAMYDTDCYPSENDVTN